MSSDPNSPRSQALSFIADVRFHRRFILPATADHDSLNVTYADVGRVPATPGQDVPTLLFIGGMFCSRYIGVFLHPIAERLGVRVLVVDRPGMGHSTNVPLDKRLPVWLELVPRLSAHLAIDHVSLVSHSAGTIYLLNTLYHCRRLLHPERPYVALLAPWVDPAHSGVTAMQLAQCIPTKAFGIWNRIPQFFLNAAPVLGSSGAVINKISCIVSKDNSEKASSAHAGKNRRRIEKVHGVTRDVQLEQESLVSRFLFLESTVGANSEALLCLRKGPLGSWGDCEDYEQFARILVDLERRAGPTERAPGESNLKVQAYFAETDSMIAERGQSYVENCWKGKDDEFDDVLDFESTTVAGVDHDTLCHDAETWEQVFVDAGGVRPQMLLSESQTGGC